MHFHSIERERERERERDRQTERERVRTVQKMFTKDKRAISERGEISKQASK